MSRKSIACILSILLVLCLSILDAHAKKPEVTRHDAQYLDRQVSVNLQWQSSELVVLIRVAAGREVKELKIDPYDNKKTRSGYTGEVHVVLQAEPLMNQDAIPYTIQVEDEDGQKSSLTTGKVAVPTAAPAVAQDDQWGKEKLAGSQSGHKDKDMIEQLRQVAQALAAPPFLNDVTVNNPGTGTVTFKTKATHSVGLKEINFRVIDSGNKQVDSQQILTTGKFWEGTSKDFSLGSGTYFVIAQAVDGSGSTSQERKANFTIRDGIPPPPVQPPPQLPQPDQQPQQPAVTPSVVEKELLTGTDLKGLQGWTIQEWMRPTDRKGELTEEMDGLRFRNDAANSRMGIMQTIDADVSGAQKLVLNAVVKAVAQRLDGTGWQGREAPVAVMVTYTDVNGLVRKGLGSMANPPEPQADRMFWHGFYYLDPTGNSQNWNGTKVAQGSWYTYEVDLMSLDPKPKIIHAVGAEGSGWPTREGKISSISLKYFGPLQVK